MKTVFYLTFFTFIGYQTAHVQAAPTQELLHFTAQCNQHSCMYVEWASYTAAGFELLRSTDGINFSQIAWVNGAGKSMNPMFYSFTDCDVLKNAGYYYRLKEVDPDSSFEFTYTCYSVISDSTCGISVVIRPNPFTSNTTIEFSLKQPAPVSLKIYDVLGKVVFAGGTTHMEVGTHQLPYENVVSATGLFFVELNVDGVKVRKRVVRVE